MVNAPQKAKGKSVSAEILSPLKKVPGTCHVTLLPACSFLEASGIPPHDRDLNGAFHMTL